MNQILMMSNDPILKRKNLEVLIGNGFQVTDVSDALDGLLMVDKDGFSAIIIDEELADIDGYKATQKIRQYSQIPIILLGSGLPEDVWSKVDELGFDIYLKKPISPRELVAQVKSVVKRFQFDLKDRKYPDNGSKGAGMADTPDLSENAIKTVDQVISSAESHIQKGTELIDEVKKNSDELSMPTISGVTSPHKTETLKPELVNTATDAMGISPKTLLATNMAMFEETKNIRLADEVITDSAEQEKNNQEKNNIDIPTLEVWADANMAKLVDLLASGRLNAINPTIDSSAEDGFTYEEVDRSLNAASSETISILETLAKGNVLNRTPFEKVYKDADGSLQLVPVERCPNCGSGTIVRGQLIEHFYCGNVGMEQDYKVDHKYNCPKCNKELKLLGTDYRNIGIHYKCTTCQETFPAPVIKWRNLKTGKIWDFEELHEIQLYSYHLNADRKEWLEFQLKPKAQLVEFLKSRGYKVEELAKVQSSSGAVHTVDILASRDDGLSKYHLGIEVLIASKGKKEVGLERLFEFDTKAYDIGLNYKVVLVMPRLSSEAAKFASRQKIGVFEANDPTALIAFLGRQKLMATSVLPENIPQFSTKSGTFSWPQGKIATYLSSKGYEVHENAKIKGKSGAEYTFDIFAQRDDVIIKPAIVVSVLSVEDKLAVGIDKISQFDAETFDAGLRNRVVIGIPQISPEAKQFARQQRIKLLEESELRAIIGA